MDLIFEDHTDIIRRGKSQSPNECGHKVLIATAKSGLITQYQVLRGNPADDELFDEALRCALTNMMKEETCDCKPPAGSDTALRYLRDRINVPRDMSIYAAKRLRQSLEDTAALVGDKQGIPIPFKHRRDQDPINFS